MRLLLSSQFTHLTSISTVYKHGILATFFIVSNNLFHLELFICVVVCVHGYWHVVSIFFLLGTDMTEHNLNEKATEIKIVLKRNIY